jgi:hypothetical protein
MRTYSQFICVICTTPDYEFVCTFFFYFYKLQTCDEIVLGREMQRRLNLKTLD